MPAFDRQTDGRTNDDSIYHASIASCGKNGSHDSDHAPIRVICPPYAGSCYRLPVYKI